MSPKEKKELVGYLKKETDRLTKAIRKAYETGRLGRVAHYEQMRDAFANTLNKLWTESLPKGMETQKELKLPLVPKGLLRRSGRLTNDQ